jgi:hypothetical protein
MSNQEVTAMSVEQIDILKASAQDFGFDRGVIADILEKFGPDVLALVVEAARNGFSIQWIMDTFNKFGPTVLRFLSDLFSRNMAMAEVPMSFDGSPQTGVVINGDLIEGMDSNLISTLLEKLLPMLLEKYGPMLIDFLMKLFLDALKPKVGVVMSEEDKFGGRIIETLLPRLLPIILEKYGPQLIEALIQAILNAIKPKANEPATAPATAGPVVHTGVVIA